MDSHWSANSSCSAFQSRGQQDYSRMDLASSPFSPYFSSFDDTGWDSQLSAAEWVTCEELTLLHCTHFATEWEKSMAPTLATFLDAMQFDISLTSSHCLSESGTANWVYRVGGATNHVTGDLFEILFDTGASHTFTHCLSDFVTPLVDSNLDIGGFLGDSSPCQGKGLVEWSFLDDKGISRILRTEAYYVPNGNRRLFSPQRHFTDWKRKHGRSTTPGRFLVSGSGCKYTDNDGWSVRWLYHDLPLLSAHHVRRLKKVQFADEFDLPLATSERHQCNHVCDPSNMNMSTSKKELSLWHQRTGHLNFQWLQYLMRVPTDPSSSSIPRPHIPTHQPGTRSVQPPYCAACQFAKQKRRSTGAKLERHVASRVGALKQDDIRPGACVSLDHYESSVRGRLLHTAGKEPWYRRLIGGMIAVDHASGFVKTYHQPSLSTSDTLRSKHKFEHELSTYGVQVKSWHADGGIFKSKEFRDDIQALRQTLISVA